jgi:nucleoside-diphosphate-sugar epimerase
MNDLAKMIINISRKNLYIKNVPGPIGVNARTSDNTMIETSTGWKPCVDLRQGIQSLYHWIDQEIEKGIEK